MKTISIKHKWFSESDLRLDASYHLSDGPLTKLKLKNSVYEVTTLSKVTKDIYKGNIFKRSYVDNPSTGFHFMTASDMMKTNIESGKFVSKKYTNVANLLLKKGWILVSRSGTIGNTVYTNEDFEGILGTDDLIRVIPSEKEILSGYIYAYLTSKYGYGLLTQSGYGGVVQHIEPHHIENLPIPILPVAQQQEIHNLIIDASNLRVEANKLLNEAINYFEQEYKVEGFTKVFSKKINSLGFSWASYNNNLECDKIENNFQEELSIGDLATKCFAPPLFKHIYLSKDNGHPFLTGAELTKFIKKHYRWLSPRGVKNINDYKVEKGTLLLYKSGTTDGGILGNVFIADDILHGTCLSDHVIRITTEELRTSYWLYAFLKSSSGVKLLQKMATGSMIPFITPDRLLQVKVPKPNDKLDWVFEKIEGYIAKSSESHRKELKAIDLVEKEIESWQK
jgi:type I restriction enzyme S subunit